MTTLTDLDIEIYRPILLSLAHSWTGQSEAEDAVQEAFCNYLMDPVDTGNVLADLSMALSTICNGLRQSCRRLPTTSLTSLADLPQLIDIVEPQLTAAAQERWATLPLTPRQREVMQFHLDGHSNDVIAHSLVISPRTVRHHLQRTREALETNRVTLSEFRSVQEMFDYCAHQYVYWSPLSVGSSLRGAQLRKLK
jgi:DNA-binding NarL/FixJ family response regulator